jgi:excinuclease UvrABC helicase subunit UvrB
MRNFGFNGMNDDEFMREFIKILNMYQSSVENFMKKNYESKNFMSNPFFNILPINEDELKEMFKNIEDNFNVERGGDDNSEWEKRTWSSPDGSSSFSSFSRNSFYNPFDGKVKFKENQEDIDTIQLLEKKLNKAIESEKYEDAAKIRDLINNLKEDKKNEEK